MNAEDIAQFQAFEERLAEAIYWVEFQQRNDRADKLIADLAEIQTN